MPLRLDIGASSSLAGGEESITRISTLVPSATTTIWPEATHSLPMNEYHRIGEELTLFWKNQKTARSLYHLEDSNKFEASRNTA